MDKLYLNPGNVNLLDNLAMPASVIVNGRTCFSNLAMKKEAGLNIPLLTDMASGREPGCAGLSLKICRKMVRTVIIHADQCEYSAVGIRYKGDPGFMLLSGLDHCSPPLSEFLLSMDKLKGIEKVLLVDDNPMIIETYRSILQLLGYETFQFTCPAAALESMEHEQFDLLISDYDMPGMNGFDLLKNFHSRRPGLPVIIISGAAGFPCRMSMSEFSGEMVSFMNKPVAMNDLDRSLEVMEFFYKLCRFRAE